jgi:hypothetical protein
VIKRSLSVFTLAVVLMGSALTVRADSIPVIAGGVTAVELCQQATCGAAIFVGLFRGQVGANTRAIGTMAVAVTHEDLPEPGETAAITGGVWVLQLLSGRKFTGPIAGGALLNNGNDTFALDVHMALLSGGVGDIRFRGTLSHVTFPPTIIGAITQ